MSELVYNYNDILNTRNSTIAVFQMILIYGIFSFPFCRKLCDPKSCSTPL